MMSKTDVLIIGDGVAGLSTTIELVEEKPELEITVLTKVDKSISNST